MVFATNNSRHLQMHKLMDTEIASWGVYETDRRC